MRIAALFDIHGNLPALEAVLHDVRQAGVDLVVVGGDVLPGPMPHESLGVLRALALPVRCIRGNGDRIVMESRAGEESPEVPVAFREVVRWNAAQLTPSDVAFVSDWPVSFRQYVAGVGDVLFCHATPRSDTENFTRLTPEARILPAFGGVAADVIVCGHTHMQFDRTIGAHRVVNAGSVGMPFGAPGAYWLLLGARVELRHTSYDLDAAADRVVATAYPQAQHFAEQNVRHPPTEQAMLAALS
jgi:putative phosphoesterase